MKHITILVLGDWSHDGHSKSSIVTIRSNFTKHEIEGAYQKGIQKIGMSFVEEIGVEYEEYGGCLITPEQIELLENAGIDTSDIEPPTEWQEGHRIYEECFVQIYMDIAALGDPELEWERVSHEENHLRIGGYGLFS